MAESNTQLGTLIAIHTADEKYKRTQLEGIGKRAIQRKETISHKSWTGERTGTFRPLLLDLLGLKNLIIEYYNNRFK
jgi:hypothetical protein